jgi:aspartyl-tRNA synthetase
VVFRTRSNCGDLSLSDVGRDVQVAGWVDALRDHGEVFSIHLRDRKGAQAGVGCRRHRGHCG